MNVQNAAMQILKEAGKPLHAKEIYKRMTKTGLWVSDSKTPEATVSAGLYSHIKKHGDQSIFILVAPQTFALRDMEFVAVCNAKQFKLKNSSNSTDRNKETYSFLNAAEKVLEQFGNQNAMHYGDITEKALAQGWLNTKGKTPKATMRSDLMKNIKRARARGKSSRFVRTSPGYYGLTKWEETGLPYQISKHNRDVREKVMSWLMKFSPTEFEELVGQLLVEMGFKCDNTEPPKRRNDGGIDFRGTLLIGDVIYIKLAVQVKLWKHNIQSPIVQQVRGSLGVHEQGLIVTTSNFSAGAIEEANKPNKKPVALMNGEKLITLLMEYNIGVRRKSYELFELDSN